MDTTLCPLMAPAHLRPAWVSEMGAPDEGSPSFCRPICSVHGASPHPGCAAPGCACPAMLCPDRGDGEPYCEGHWLDSK